MTGRFFKHDEALQQGFVNKVFDTKEEMLAEAVKMAKHIASKSPAAVWTIKHTLNFARDHNVNDGLDMIADINSAMCQTVDMENAING